ncbi:MAG: hypothetical protein ACK55I_40825, partial [bacterium]
MLQWVGVEEQHGGALQVGAFGQTQARQQCRIGLGQGRLVQAATAFGESSEAGESRRRQIRCRDTRQRRTVPRAPVTAQQKAIQRGAFELLQGAAAALVVAAPIADGRGVGGRRQFQHLMPALGAQVHLHHHAQQVTHLVGQVFQQLARLGQA